MKTRIWSLGLVMMMALLVGASATTAEAVSFSFQFGGCSASDPAFDTLCLIPVFGGVPDSVRWYYSGAPVVHGPAVPTPPFAARDIAPPYDTCFVWAGAATGRDSIVMHAWFAAVDSSAGRSVLVDYMVAINDGRNCNENDSVLVNVLVNDTTSTPDTNVVIAPYNPIGNGPFHGRLVAAVYVDGSMKVWYVPDLGYNGTDNFVYQVTNGCGTPDTAVVSITILSNGLLCFDSCWYEWKDVPCACDDSAGGLGAISIGDSLRVCARICPWDLDELTAGWPRADLPGIAGSNLTMIQDTSAALGMLDTTLFCWPGRTIDTANTWFEVTPGNLDVAAGFYEIYTRARSKVSPFQISACTTSVTQAIDNKAPDLGSGAATWVLWRDVNGDGVATTVDTMRFFIDLRNEPFEEICKVYVTLYGFPTSADTGILANSYPLYEIAGDNRWAMVLKVPPGDLENFSGPYTAVFHYVDNACNEDSVTRQYSGPVDNTAPDCNCIVERTYEKLTDLDSNNCISLGETVRIRVRDTCNTDISAYYVDLFSDTTWRLGLGSNNPADSSHRRVQLNNLGGGYWGVDWVLGKYPLRNAIDTTAIKDTVPWVWLHAADDAGNPLTCDSLKIVWSETNKFVDEIDARAPSPLQLLGCYEDTTFIGTRAVRIRFRDTTGGPGMQDIARFRMFYDKGTGVIDYVDTLAGLNWGDTVGGGGTNGLSRPVPYVPDVWDWTTDGTVELSWCRDYLFNIWVIDSCGNHECLHPDSVLCKGQRPDPVTYLDCTSEDKLNICLEWKTAETSADSFCIFMASDGKLDTAKWVATVDFSDTGAVYTWCTDDANLSLIENRWYDFIVLSYDSCGGVQADSVGFNGKESFITKCLADVGAPVVCVFQPKSLSPGGDTTLYSCDRCTTFLDGSAPNGMWIYVRPCNDTSLDVRSIDSVLIRLADSAGSPGRWVNAGFYAQGGPNHWAIQIDCESLDLLVREDDSVEVVQVMVISTDAAGRTGTRDKVKACCGYFEFKWSNYRVDVLVKTVDGKVQTYQPYCNAHGYGVWGPNNDAEICIGAGTPPYKIRLRVEPPNGSWSTAAYVENVYAACTTLTFSAVGWPKGLGDLEVAICDAAGHYDNDQVPLCVGDSIPPCAAITNPVDGKCIRRSRSMLDPVDVCVTLDPLGNCLDPGKVLKIDYEWAETCCKGQVPQTIRVCDSTPIPGGGSAVCDTFVGGVKVHGVTSFDSVVCVDTGFGGYSIHCHDSTFYVDCADTVLWHTFAIQPGSCFNPIDKGGFVEGNGRQGGDYCCVQWWNTMDLAWVDHSGQIIYLRAVLYDDQGNKFTTPCVTVCVDIDTPPLCLWSPDVCYGEGMAKLSGSNAVLVADLNLDSANIDDLEHVYLYWKKSTDPDLYTYWQGGTDGLFGAYPPGTNSTVWKWEIDPCNLAHNQFYDFRVIAKTTTGFYSYDMDGDRHFDDGTYDSSGAHCDMKRWYIDCQGPQIAIDTIWTSVNGNPVVQPNVGCTLSDPRGWFWAQDNTDITMQPNIYPFADKADLAGVRWTLYPFDGASCDCGKDGRGGGSPTGSNFNPDDADSFVIAIREGTHALDTVTFNPKDIQFVQIPHGNYGIYVLHVVAWDSCGNWTQDCAKLYLLDTDTTEVIITDPMNDEVFCNENGSGGIDVTASALLAKYFNRVVFAYRAAGSETWIPFDSVGKSGDNDYNYWWPKVTWYPQALGLPDGAYELTAWAIDNALNRQTNTYITTVFLSCAAPTDVAVTNPKPFDAANPVFLGCDMELSATALGTATNPVTEVCFYYVGVTQGLGDATQIGCDDATTDGTWHYHWVNPNLNGSYYIWAKAWNKAGKSTTSAKIWVKFDNDNPSTQVIQVGSDGSDGGCDDATSITAGETVSISAWAWDRGSSEGYGRQNNCGVDSVLIYVWNTTGYGYCPYYWPDSKVFGAYAKPSNTIDSLYTATWNTAGLQPGKYIVQSVAYDCACNSGNSSYWWIDVKAPQAVATISLDGPTICDYPSADYEAHVHVTVPSADYIDYIELYYSSTAKSDVEDQYDSLGEDGYDDNPDGSRTYHFVVYTNDWAEGLWRFRAFLEYTDGTYSEDGDHNGSFDDFTFNDALPHHMLVRIDHSVHATVSAPSTLKAHRQLVVNVTTDPACDLDHVCNDLLGITQDAGDEDKDTCLASPFNPVDSSYVTVVHGIWQGTLRTTAWDALGNSDEHTQDLWILDMDSNQVRVTSPKWLGYVTKDTTTITARKLSSATIDSVQFFFGPQSGAGTYIGTDHSASGDEFSVNWVIANVADGSQWLWAKAYMGSSGDANAPRVQVTKAKSPTHIVMKTPSPSYQRTVSGEVLTFVGQHTDLCLWRDSISTINTVGIDSVVWCFRGAEVPGIVEPPSDSPNDLANPHSGWVRIGSDVYGSLCTDWFTNWCEYWCSIQPKGGDKSAKFDTSNTTCDCCSDGRYTVVAWVYDKAGNVNHSVPIDVMIDNTDPFTEVVDIDGDETFGTCHDVVATNNSQVKISAVAIDDHSCVDSSISGIKGSSPYYNSGAKYLQFFVGNCDAATGQQVDILWVVDATYSMWYSSHPHHTDELISQASTFIDGLSGLDYRVGVLGFAGENPTGYPMGANGDVKYNHVGEWTTNTAAFATMVNGTTQYNYPLPGGCGGGDNNCEYGLQAISNGLNQGWYNWRQGAKRVVILVTDEDADDASLINVYGPGIINSGATIFTVWNQVAPTGYETLSPLTGGFQYDINANWGATMSGLASGIRTTSVNFNDLGVLWSRQVDLTDGQSNAYALWDPSGLNPGKYCVWTVAIDEVGNDYTSRKVEICLEDKKSPVAYISGFGMSTDEHMNHEYTIYGQSWDTDIDYVQFQERLEADANNAHAWAGIGVSYALDAAKQCWATKWNPCLLSGNYQLRVIATDKSGNEADSLAPIAHVVINSSACQGGGTATVEPTGLSVANGDVWFEDTRYDELGMVNLDVSDNPYHNSMIAVWADLLGGLNLEKIALWQPDPDPAAASQWAGNFKGSASVKLGGTGWFWQAYNDNNKTTHLKRTELIVDPVTADARARCSHTHALLGAKACLEINAITQDNGIVIFPARIPTLNLSQQHFQAWPAYSGHVPVVAAIRFTNPINGSFSTGTYAHLDLSADVDSTTKAKDLTVAWWNGSYWDANTGIIAGSEITITHTGGLYVAKAKVSTTNLSGLYAIVSAGRVCNSGALTVEPAGAAVEANGFVPSWPTIYTRVKSNIESGNGNIDINKNEITVVLDGNT
ncbi:MAG: hypothetical protein HY304_05820, partial [candidate division Zixibacteria bacterium]|nr:hypothetical protein [candidate division Zixibacteria bacterium]